MSWLNRRKARDWLGIGAAAALLLVIASRWETFAAAAASADRWLLAVLFPVTTLLTVLAPIGWHRVIRSLGARLGWLRSVEIWMVAAAARFVPGGIWTFAGRLALTREAGIDTTTVGLSLYLETLLIAATSLAIGLPALLLKQPTALAFALPVAVLVILMLLLRPGTIRFLSARLPAQGAGLPAALPKMGTLALFYCAYWCLWGALFAAFAAAFQRYSPGDAVYVACSFALAYWAGFVSFVFPGGVGIREGVLFAMLTHVFPAPVALAISVSLRVWMICAEFPVLAAALWLGRRRHAAGALTQDQDVGRQ